MRSNFEKWGPSVAARLTSMSSCGWQLLRGQRRPHRADDARPKSAAPKAR